MMKIPLKDLFFARASDFLGIYLAENLSRSQNTISSYRDALSIFRRYVHDVKKISAAKFKVTDCSVDLVFDYRIYLKESGCRESTINHRVSVIKTYLKYISQCDAQYLGSYLKINDIPPMKVPVGIKPILDDEMLKLVIEEASYTKKPVRNTMILILLYDTAVRVSELTGIRLSDVFLVDEKMPYIHIHGKGDKDRIVVLSEPASEHLKYYLKKYHDDHQCEYLFYTCVKGRYDRISVSSIEKLLDGITERLSSKGARIPDSIHPHMFRRTRSTHLYQDGVPLEQISRILGHSYLETTKIYAQMSKEQIKEIIEVENDKYIEPEWDDEDEIIKMFGLK